jgi:holo-[acyl-carrier protein] synthase
MALREFLGIGCDVEETGRFHLDRTKDAKFLCRFFTAAELNYCFSFEDPAPHLAARYCAKEAVEKALGAAGEEPVEYEDIEIENHSSGAPFITIHAKRENLNKKYTIQVSMSHCRTTAMAIATVSILPGEDP